MKLMIFLCTISLTYDVYSQSGQLGSAIGKAKEALSSESLSSLLDQEQAAASLYDQVLEKVPGAQKLKGLKEIRDNHQEAAKKLTKFVGKADAGAAGAGTSTWDSVKSALTKGGGLLGNSDALSMLKKNEEESLERYLNVLKQGDLSKELRSLLLQEIVPARKEHIEILNKFI